MLQRQKPALGPNSGSQQKDTKKKKRLPKLEDFLQARDYTGAITLLEVNFFVHTFCLKIRLSIIKYYTL